VNKKELSYNAATLLMQDRRARLVLTHGGGWQIMGPGVKGGIVSAATATLIRTQDNIVGCKDGLFPGHDQTWRHA
jgi:hypothetical protein